MLNTQKKLDPSENKQLFHGFNLKVHCCRYWQLAEWECKDMAFPFWRVYHNTIGGARIFFQNETIAVENGHIIIIPPNTSYSNALVNQDFSKIRTEAISGRRILRGQNIGELQNSDMVDHFFVHFNLGLPLDNFRPGIYKVPISYELSAVIEQIKEAYVFDRLHEIRIQLSLFSFISGLLLNLSANDWADYTIDKRISKTIGFILKNLGTSLSNEDLASRVNLTGNSLARLFKKETGEAIQQFIQKKRIEKAQSMLHHSSKSIDDIALECGFYDRSHFSKYFTSVIHLSPVKYRKLYSGI